MDVRSRLVGITSSIMKITLVIPAHNEENRIGRTLDRYTTHFKETPYTISYIVVLNGCSDNTHVVVRDAQERLRDIAIVDLQEAGKGIALKEGFLKALSTDADHIGFVDADMATTPQEFEKLIKQGIHYDGIIASRYLKESIVVPARPWVKEWGRRLVYQPLVWALFGMRFADYQCGAKLFKRAVIETIAPALTVRQWAFDVELLYLCKKAGFTIKEVPTEWHDQADSKLKIRSGFVMLKALFKVRRHHATKKR